MLKCIFGFISMKEIGTSFSLGAVLLLFLFLCQ